MSWPTWGAITAALKNAAADLKANKPLPPSQPMTSEQILAGLNELQAAIPILQAWLQAHPGEVLAAEHLLEPFADAGLPWAKALMFGVSAAPGAVGEEKSWLPDVIMFLQATAAAPTYQDGPGSYRGR